ncbi:PadR family transcriptional regulator [Pseudoclavibacter sp. RFBG4]|uniref:PadR family transcriptional regulator n=1 Tax=unclassified Pseudoclavibacter TaxID=2615177 RepID=UPI000CE8C0D4|nr:MULTISPECIES: PadR family transcriptional regulator [unclassified Pseudoclavibacter]MBF4457864.1 PadR family transcriptional regulator [Pseudoclavibacter sp. VKM Ac-2867]MBF4551544.1 PadR family transcriptional regulator [Pseudoclavibacter sp. VKM Ac-2888]PPF37056.1 PadR family transcriptional regulator [Pseudoclavibacter sp. AY1H1]PPF78478.1 PadR family transcriptional regulator [Pseudoclavibacter sp. Z016]PPG01880.1 PadR family transcriptional regulator [Pseudoclavibacter sp. RFBI5]
MTTSVGAQLRKGVVEYCVLGLLQQGPMYGWLISERLVSLGLIGSIGTLYPLMTRLRERELIAAHADDSDSARPRKYYAITSQGHAELEQFRSQWAPFASAVEEVTQSRTTTTTTASDSIRSRDQTEAGDR